MRTPSQRYAWSRFETHVLYAIIGGILGIALAGCFDTPPLPGNLPTGKPTLEAPAAPAPGSLAAKDAELAMAMGTVARLTTERNTLRQAPLRTSLLWIEGVALLGAVVCVGLAVAAAFWGLGFAWKIPAGLALLFAAVFVTCLGFSAALDHLAWIIGALAALVAIAIAWAIHRQVTVAGAARTLWQHVADDAPTPATVDRLLQQMTGDKPAAKA